jgi:hypothetical protein
MPRKKTPAPTPAAATRRPATIVQAPRGYFEEEPQLPLAGALVSKTGEEPTPYVATPPVDPGFPAELFEDRALIVLAMRQDGYTTDEIVEKTKLTIGQVRYAMFKARQSGKLRDVIDLIDNEAVPQAVENLLKKLRKNNETNEFGDAEIQVLKGRGVFQNFNKNQGGPGGTVLPNLQINFINKDGGDLPAIIVNSDSGEVLGKARE